MTSPQPAQHRSGRYVRQATGYSAFIPRPLPPDPPLELVGRILELLSQADRALGRLDGSIRTLPTPDHLVLMYVRKEAVLSSQIEGTQSSLQDLLEAEAKIFDSDRPRDVAEVVNYVRAMRHGLDRLDELPVSVRLIREIHAELVRGVRGGRLTPGELRRSQNWIGPSGSMLADAIFVPPPPHELPKALGDLEHFLHTDRTLPLLTRIGMAHAQFETIHPFLDGNGRVGRLLITLLLCEQDVLSQPVLYLSNFFKQHRQEYYDRLQATRDRGDWESWLEFFLRGVAEVAREAAESARRVLELRETHRTLIVDTFGRTTGSAITVLEALFAKPIVSVGQVQTLTGTTYPPANELVRRFVQAGMLIEITGRTRNRRFSYQPYIDIFSTGP